MSRAAGPAWVVLALCGLWLCLTAAPSPAPPGPASKGPEALLRRGLSAARSLPLRSREVTTRWMQHRSISTVYRRYRLGGRERLEYLTPRSMAGRLVFLTPTGHWQYNPRTRQALFDPALDVGAGWDVNLLRRNYVLRLGPRSETVAERPCYRLDLVPRWPGKGKRVLWLDKATGIVLKSESYHGDGSPAGTTYTTEVAIGKPIPAALLTFSPPKGTRVSRLKAPARVDPPRNVRVPAELPGGYRLLSRRPVADPGGRLHFTYFDGVDLLSYYVQPTRGRRPSAEAARRTVNGHPAALVSDHHFTVLRWQAAGYSRSLVGDVGSRLLFQIASGL